MCLTEPALILVDARLLHGLVVTTYIRTLGILDIFIVDDGIFNDKILQQIYELVKPPETSVHFLSLQQAALAWKDDGLAYKADRPYMILMRDVANVKSLYEMGMQFKKIAVSNMKAAPNKKRVQNVYFFDETDIQMIDYLVDNGVSVSFREKASWESIKADYLNNPG